MLNNDVIVDKGFFARCFDLIEEKTTRIVSPAIVDYLTGKVKSTGGDIIFKK